jgi:hypothetical protein
VTFTKMLTICLKFIPSIILPYPPPSILRVVSKVLNYNHNSPNYSLMTAVTFVHYNLKLIIVICPLRLNSGTVLWIKLMSF